MKLIQRRDDNEITFDGTLADCDVCAVGKNHQLTHPQKAKNADIKAPFQLVHGDLMGPFSPAAHGNNKYASKITYEFSRWTAVYLHFSKDQALASLQVYVTSMLTPYAIESFGFASTRAVNTPVKIFRLTA